MAKKQWVQFRVKTTDGPQSLMVRSCDIDHILGNRLCVRKVDPIKGKVDLFIYELDMKWEEVVEVLKLAEKEKTKPEAKDGVPS